MKKIPTPEEAQIILGHYMKGNGVNQVVFLLNYAFDADDINKVIRDEIKRLAAAFPEVFCKDEDDDGPIADAIREEIGQ